TNTFAHKLICILLVAHSVSPNIKPGWQVRQTKPVGYISLHYCAPTDCQVMDARPRVQCVILEGNCVYSK
uniref:Uncharacterized protein n=1 Tax=Echeneis naucrates TaxID=173247 RepID=A0A665X6T9_ECHNA